MVVVTPSGGSGNGIDGAIAPLVALTIALLLAVGAAVALRYQRIREAALIDPVTGLPNRRAFNNEAERLIAKASNASPLSLLLLDIELEHVNMTGGHTAGDRLLRAVTTHLCEIPPDDATPYKLAGGRFAMMLAAGAWNAFELAAELHRHLEDEEHIDVRIGVSELGTGGSVDQLVSSADAAAAEASRSGRGIVVFTLGLDAFSHEDPDAQRQHALAIALARAVDAKDSSTRSHCEIVAELSALIASELDLDPEHVARVRLAGLVHDVGKIGVPDAILQKPAALSEEEFEVIKGHAAGGHKILAGTDLAAESEWVRHHHERVDGRGYPDGISGDQLALEARILHVADAFEAMTSDRPYRRAMSQADAVAELLRHSGTQFDVDCVTALIIRLGPLRDAPSHDSARLARAA